MQCTVHGRLRFSRTRNTLLTLVMLLASASFFAPAATAGPTDCEPYPCCKAKKAGDPPCPAAYHNMRFMENWSPCLAKDRCSFGDWTDALKVVPLNCDKSIWASFGGQIRLRYESFDNIGFGAPADAKDAWLLFRARAHADVHFGKNLRVFVEGIFADQFDERELGPRPIDINRGDLLNAFAEVNTDWGCSDTIGAWLGRRELQFGKQRLVSPLDWANTRRTFQGGGVWWKRPGHRVDAFYTRPVTIEDESFDDEWNEDRAFFGVYYQNTTMNCANWDLYFLGLQHDMTTMQTEQDRYTIGARVGGKAPGTRFDYDVEAAYQFGELGNGDISAWMASATLGYSPCLPCSTLSPRFAIGLDYASGDDDAADPDIGTFNQLFPLGHAYFGHADVLGRQNLLAGRVEASIKPAKNLTLHAWYHMFWRADDNDAVYNVGGGVLRAVPVGGLSDTEIGSELDVRLLYKIDRHWTAFAEWAHFFTGDFIDNSGAHKDLDVFYIGVQGTF